MCVDFGHWANSNAENIQGTIWNMFGGPFNGSGDFFTLTVPSAFTLTRNWYVLSDDNERSEESSQEYLTFTAKTSVVPEPWSCVLMGADLLALDVVSRRRRIT